MNCNNFVSSKLNALDYCFLFFFSKLILLLLKGLNAYEVNIGPEYMKLMKKITSY